MKFCVTIKNIILSLFGVQTVGTRALVIKDQQILLVTHTYMPGWCSIGGGVDKGESPINAIKRELREEVGIKLNSAPRLFNVYYNNFQKRDDYVVLYICDDFVENDTKSWLEIKEKKWFRLNNLPKDITPSTKRRIEEYLELRDMSDKW